MQCLARRSMTRQGMPRSESIALTVSRRPKRFGLNLIGNAEAGRSWAYSHTGDLSQLRVVDFRLHLAARALKVAHRIARADVAHCSIRQNHPHHGRNGCGDRSGQLRRSDRP